MKSLLFLIFLAFSAFKSPLRAIMVERIRRESMLSGKGEPPAPVICNITDSEFQILTGSDGEQLLDGCNAFTIGFSNGFA